MSGVRIESAIWKTSAGSYQVRYRDSSGRQRARSFERLTDARNFRAQARLLRPRHGNLDPIASRITFEGWADAYLDQKVSLRERTRDRYKSELRVHLVPFFGERTMFSISRNDVQDFILTLVARGLAANTIKGVYCLLASMMRLAEEDGVIEKTPCRRISLPPTIINERRFLSAPEVERLAAAIDARYRALIHTAAYLGLRWQEIAGLRLRYLELERGRPATLRVISTIERSGGRCHVVDVGKTKAARRTLVMPEFLRVALVDHVSKYSDDVWVFAAPKGGFLRYDNFRSREWSPAVERAGLAPLTFHCVKPASPLPRRGDKGHDD